MLIRGGDEFRDFEGILHFVTKQSKRNGAVELKKRGNISFVDERGNRS